MVTLLTVNLLGKIYNIIKTNYIINNDNFNYLKNYKIIYFKIYD